MKEEEMSNKDKFKVYSNTGMPRKKLEEEIEISLEVPHEDMVAGLFLTSPYFMDLVMANDYFYYPADVETEESLMAPVLNEGVLHDFLDSTEAFRQREGIPAALLLRVPGQEEEEEDLVSLFDGRMQMEILKFFRTVVAIMNQDMAMEDNFDEIFESLVDEVGENGYLDSVLGAVAEYMSDPDFLEGMLFPEEEE